MTISKKLVGYGRELTRDLKKLKRVKVVGIGGSAVNGFADKYSDIDMYCYCYNPPTFSQVKKVLAMGKILKYFPLPEQPDEWILTFDYKGFQCCVQFRKIKTIKTWLDHYLRLATTYTCVLPASFILDVKPLYDPKRKLAKLKKKMKFPKNPKNLIVVPFDIVKDIMLSDDILPYLIKRKSYPDIEMKLNTAFRNYLHVLYSLNKKFFTTAKWYDKDIRRFRVKPRNCVRRIRQIAILGNKGTALKRKIKIFKSLIKDTGSLVDRYRKK